MELTANSCLQCPAVSNHFLQLFALAGTRWGARRAATSPERPRTSTREKAGKMLPAESCSSPRRCK
eukprot:10158139-Alexandrium_andersonii.AAC.1